MPKIKSKRGAVKRFKVTANGKILRNRAFGSHLLAHKSSKRKRRLKQKALISKRDRDNIKRSIPYFL
jgi:large subunit ribosomal protein L35